MSDPFVIQAEKPYSVSLQTQKMVIPYRGVIESATTNERLDQVLTDLVSLQRQGNVNAAAILNYAHTLQHESDRSRQMTIALQEQQDLLHQVLTMQNLRTGFWYDLHDGSEISFVPNSDISKRASVSTQFGQATIPMNAVESKTYSIRLIAEEGITKREVLTSAAGSFDKQDGNGVVAYEGGTNTPVIEELAQANAVNGNNLEYWRRRVMFPLESDVSEIEVEFTITLPTQANLYANCIYLHPYPLGNVDVTGLWVSPDLSDSFVMATPTWSDVKGARKTRWFMPSQQISKVKVRLRQRNWFEENGRKVFEYGLQELGVQLIEWDMNYTANAALTDNHAFVTRIEAPTGMVFHKLHGIYTAPDYLLEAAGSRHLHFVLSKVESGANALWNSDTMSAPQAMESPVDLGLASELFMVTTLNWAETVGAGSPFQAGTPPFLNGFGLDVRLLKETS